MVQTAITDQALQRAKPPAGKRLELWDAYVEGFGYRASQKGKGSFFIMFRMGGKQRRLTIGRYPVMSLEEARASAKTALKSAKEGRDPALEEDQRRADIRSKQERTVAGAVADFLALYGGYKPSTLKEVTRLLNRELVAGLGDRPISSITRKDIAKVVNIIHDRGAKITANRIYSYMQAFFGWLVERGELDATPITNLAKPAKENSRDRVLDDNELSAIWIAAGKAGQPFGAIVRLLMATGQRRSEVAGMRWADLDLEAASPVWRIPREMTKTDKAHEVPLSPIAVEVLSGLPAYGLEAEKRPVLVFPAKGKSENPFSGWSKSKTEIDAKATEIVGSDMAGWTLHDLRRSAASGMAALGIAPHVIEKLLNHSGGEIRGVAAIYNRHSYAPELRRAVDKWSDHLKGLIDPKQAPAPDNVIQLRAGK